MLKKLYFSCLLLTMAVGLVAQNIPVTRNDTVVAVIQTDSTHRRNLDYRIGSVNYLTHIDLEQPKNNLQFRVEFNYDFARYFQGGFYFGLGNYVQVKDPPIGNWGSREYSPLIGINTNLDLIPLIDKYKESYPLELYLTFKGGTYYCNGGDYDTFKGFYGQTFLGAGIAIHSSTVGIFLEYGLENQALNRKNPHGMLFMGLSLR